MSNFEWTFVCPRCGTSERFHGRVEPGEVMECYECGTVSHAQESEDDDE